ncbi:MAG: glycosyltransferase [Muribaculaceae bacterium]|nr:glycosyltransferase [Muribaculaceae bacterium]
MKTTLIYTDAAKGHHPEYLHHIYHVCRKLNGHRYVFVVPEEFKSVQPNMDWAKPDNIVWEYIPQHEISEYIGKGMYGSSAARIRTINRTAEKFGADSVFALTLMELLPAAPVTLRSNISVSGIIYKIYLYERNEASLTQNLLNKLKYNIYARFKRFKTIYILNDSASADEFNRLYSSTKFKYLPDPSNVIHADLTREEVRRKLGVSPDRKLMIHIGALQYRKGTLDILDSMALLTEAERREYVFVFAGRVAADIREAFYRKVEDMSKRGVSIHVYDEFCSFTFLANLCTGADAILMPYHETSQSSGIIGYASQFGCPTIGSAKGMTGELINKYHLGYTCASTASALAQTYSRIKNEPYTVSDLYSKEHTVAAFQEHLKSGLL